MNVHVVQIKEPRGSERLNNLPKNKPSRRDEARIQNKSIWHLKSLKYCNVESDDNIYSNIQVAEFWIL